MFTPRLRLPWFVASAAALFVFSACGDDGPTTPSTGSVEVTATTTGDDIDSDGYTVTVNGGSGQSLAANGAVTISNVTTGEATVELSGVADNCTVSGDNPRTVQVTGGETASTTFEVSCTAQTGEVQVTTNTTGEDLDADGYTVEVDGTDVGSVEVNETKSFSGIDTGSRTVSLTNVASNCSVQSNDQSVTVPDGGSVSVSFDVSCSSTAGAVNVTTSTTGDDPDTDGYTVEVDASSVGSIGVNETKTFTGIENGGRTVSLSGVASNCTVQNNDQAATVPSGGSVDVTFDISCTTAPGDLVVETSTTGAQQDSEYEVVVDGGSPQVIGVNGSVIVQDLASGDHTVELTDVSANCTVSGENPRTVTVPIGGSATTTFDVSCETMGNDILFETNRDGNWEIYVMEADGSLQTNLTQNASDDRLPTWSPDRSKIAFESNREGSLDIWVMDADGTNATNLTPVLDGTKFIADWSPDGTEIAFSRRDPSGQIDIWLMNVDGTNQRQITNLASDDQQARWSPDGSQLLFRTDRDGNREIYVMNADGSSPQNLTNDPANDDGLPIWSPDGTKIAWTKHMDPTGADDQEIYIMDADGSNATNLTNHTATDAFPTFSPDGSQIAFYSTRASLANIFVMNVDGSNVVDVTQRTTRNQAPSWRAP